MLAEIDRSGNAEEAAQSETYAAAEAEHDTAMRRVLEGRALTFGDLRAKVALAINMLRLEEAGSGAMPSLTSVMADFTLMDLHGERRERERPRQAA